MSQASSKHRRTTRYEDAVRRQIEANDRWEQAEPKERMYMAKPAPVEDFLRYGDTADMFRDNTEGEAA